MARYVPDAADADSPLKPSELKVLRDQYEKEGDYVGVQTKFNYAWGLIKSSARGEQQEGVRLLSEIFRNAPERRRECLYYLALGNYKLGNYAEARRYNDLLLDHEPSNLQAGSLRGLIEDKVAKEGLLGVAILSGVAIAAAGVGAMIFKGARIDERHDPRDNHVDTSDDDADDGDEAALTNNDSLPHHALHHHSPWQAEAPDPDEPDIEHVEWNPAPGVHFARTSYRSSSPMGRGQANDPFAPFFQSISTIFEGAANANANAQGRLQARNIRAIQHPTRIHRPEFASQNPFPNHQHHHVHHHHSPWTPASGPPGGRQAFTATGRIWPQNGPNAPPNDRTINNLHGVLATMLQSMQASMVDDHGDGGQRTGMPNLNTFITQMLGGVSGDAVYSEEALDRIITQMMDQNHQGSAPGPASAAAIAALPKKPADKTMMGSDGKAECSVCMDAVEIGDEVTVLPCNHWFHGDCVGAWLKEHDTCPHCRAGIMPKEGGAENLRSPGQAPRHTQNPFPETNPPNSGTPPSQNGINQRLHVPGAFTQPGMNQPYVLGGIQRYPEPQAFVQPQAHFPPQPPQQVQRRSSARRNGNGNGSGNVREGSSGSSQGSGVTGWFRNLRGGGSSGDR